MIDALFYAFSNDSLATIPWTSFSREESLPFPLYLSPPARIFILILQTITLAIGFKFRSIIISYLRAPDTKASAINVFIWIDQINGCLLGVSILGKCVMISSPVPLSEVLGQQFCQWVDLPGCVYLAGSFIWSSLTAAYRILFIKAQNCISNGIGYNKLFSIFLATGFSIHFPISLWLSIFDYRSSSDKMCTHNSDQENAIYLKYKVIILFYPGHPLFQG